MYLLCVEGRVKLVVFSKVVWCELVVCVSDWLWQDMGVCE